MASPFDSIDADIQSAMDQVFGEAIRIVPQAGDVNYGTGPDPLRPVRDTRGIVSRAHKSEGADFIGTNRAGVDRALLHSEVWIERDAYDALGYIVRRGDLIDLIDEPGSPRVAVARVSAGDNGDVNIHLVAGTKPV